MRYDDERDIMCPKCAARPGQHCFERFDDGATVHHIFSHEERWQTYIPPGSMLTALGITPMEHREMLAEYCLAKLDEDDATIQKLLDKLAPLYKKQDKE